MEKTNGTDYQGNNRLTWTQITNKEKYDNNISLQIRNYDQKGKRRKSNSYIYCRIFHYHSIIPDGDLFIGNSGQKVWLKSFG